MLYCNSFYIYSINGSVNCVIHTVYSRKLILFSLTGNLALSRAFGDFIYKKNVNKPPEQQMVTGKASRLLSRN